MNWEYPHSLGRRVVHGVILGLRCYKLRIDVPVFHRTRGLAVACGGSGRC